MPSAERWVFDAEAAQQQRGDRLHDYCLWPYEPINSVEGKWRASTLLRHSFDCYGASAAIYQLCAALQQGLGVGQTVWGIKWVDGAVSWEFYFYDYQRLERDVSVGRVLELISPWVRCELSANELRPYFMFSLDLDSDFIRNPEPCLESLSLYLGNPGCEVSSGLSYELTAEGMVFNNLYYFFDAQREQEKVLEKLICSMHLDLPRIELEQLLWPELVDCGVIVVANKRHCDGLYFSRITVDQLIAALERLNCPAPLQAFVAQHRAHFDHLLFDVGFDYQMVNGELVISKGAYYGTF